MTEPKNLPRIYGEQEIGRILKRATELQHREPTAPGSAGMTLRELEEIAAEAGIDPTYLRRAALEVDSGVDDESFWSRVVGNDLVIVRDVSIPGELDADGFERIVATIQANSRDHGDPNLLGRTLTWRAETADKMRAVQMVVSSHGGQTRIRLEENLSQTAVGLFIGTTAGAGVGLGLGVGIPIGLEILGSALLAVATPIGFVGLSFIASRAIYSAIVRRRKRTVGTLFDRVVGAAEAAIGEKAHPGTIPESPRTLSDGG